MAKAFDNLAKNYRGRTPYLPMFFKVLSLELGLGPQSHVLDLACGLGELAVGVSPYAGKVFAIDESQTMIEEARKRPMENIEYLKSRIEDLNSADFKDARAILVGRALRYLQRDKALKFFDEILPQGAAVVACTSAIPNATIWRNAFIAVRAKYGYEEGASDFSEGDFFLNTPFQHSNTPIVRNNISFTFEALLRNAMSYRSISSLSEAKRAAFEADLAAALHPFRDEKGEYAGYIQTAGVIFRKT